LDRTEVDPGSSVNFDHPDALEAGLLADHLQALRAGEAVEIPTYDFSTHRRKPETVRVEPADFVLADGILLFAFPALRALFDGTVFVDLPEAERLARRKERDVKERGRSIESVDRQFEHTVRPMHERFVEPSKAGVDRLVSGTSDLPQMARELALWARSCASVVPRGENR
jgi:uridine kinase